MAGDIYMNDDIKFYVNGTKFAQFSSTDSNYSAMLYLRHDGGTALSISSFSNGCGISVLANRGSLAISSFGQANFHVGDDEYFRIEARSGFYDPNFGTPQYYGWFAPAVALRTESFTLPDSPKDGTLIFVKGVSSDMKITTKSHPIMTCDGRGNDVAANTQHDFNDDSVILMFSAKVNKWIEFKCW